jgi:hypothetical protein
MPGLRRQGLNATLSYPYDGQTHAYRFRCGTIMHGTEMLADESQGRTQRALYPKKQIPSQFSVTAILVGYVEHTDFSNWLASYALYALHPDRGGAYPEMTVSVPSRDFRRAGVPITGQEYGDHVGSMVWNRVVTFETSREPWDAKKPKYSRYQDPVEANAGLENRYFYPSGVQLSGDEVPADGTYIDIVKPKGVQWEKASDYVEPQVTDAVDAYTADADSAPDEGTS